MNEEIAAVIIVSATFEKIYTDAINIDAEEYMKITDSTNLSMPNSEEQYLALLRKVRERSRIYENVHGNLARNLVHGRGHSTRSHYLMNTVEGNQVTASTFVPYANHEPMCPHNPDFATHSHINCPSAAELAAMKERDPGYSRSASSSSGAVQPPQQAQTSFLTNANDGDYSSGTDSDTSSERADAESDSTDEEGLTEPERTAMLWAKYQRTKRKWRKQTHKPPRKARTKASLQSDNSHDSVTVSQ